MVKINQKAEDTQSKAKVVPLPPKEHAASIKMIKESVVSQVSSLNNYNADILSRVLDEDYEVDNEDYTTLMRHFSSEKIKANLIQIVICANSLLDQLPKKYIYHNKAHTTEQVVAWAMALASQCGKVVGEKKNNEPKVSEEDMELLFIAAMFHDTGYLHTPIKNERRGALYAELVMKKLGYTPEKIQVVVKMIMATAPGSQPQTQLENILCDSDMTHLSDEFQEFFEKSENLYYELDECGCLPAGITHKKWLHDEPAYMEKHTYYSEIAKRLLDERKKVNIEKMKAYLVARDKKHPKK